MSIQERTHDISLVGSHVKDLNAWARILNQSISASHPRAAGNRYTDVFVLLLSWEDDDLGVKTEISELDDTFRSIYGYRPEQWKIPSTQSHIALVRRILDLLAHIASGDKLTIVYYGGHAYMNDQRDCVWMANRKPQAATAQWSSIQTTLGQADSDVLILLDCCAAASSAGSPSEGHTEIIGACGFESYAPGVGHHSFTRSLIEELRYYGQLRRPVSTAFLFSKILARAKFSWNPRFERDAYSERRRTPFHIHLADISKQRCIQLTPMAPLSPPSGHAPGLHTSPSQSSSAEQSSVTSTSPSEDVDMSDPAASDPSQSSETSIESQQLQPRVLISVALEQAQILRTEDWIDWLKSFPALARWIHLESAYVSDSGLLLISLPVVVWDMLPRHPAISFISFVRSRNLLTSKDRPAGHQGTKLELLDILRADSSREKDLFYPAEMPSQWLRLENDLGWSSHFKTKQTKRKTSSERLATTFFRSEPQKKIPMEVHLPTGALITCIAHVDTAMDADVISSSLVEYLGLSKEKCKGDPVWNSPGLSREDYVGHPALMDIYTVQPPWQTTFDWHFLKFDKTFTTTFVVLDQDTSEGPDLVLGMQSIEALKFYHENNKVW